MFELDSLAKMGLQGWPLVAAIAIVCFSIVAWWNGDWPWTGVINMSTHNYYNGEEKDESEEKDS
jgi:hypothetical protein